MKRAVSLILVLSLLFVFCSCSKASDLYGVWYRDVDGVRDALQFAANAENKPVLVWVVKNLKEDTVESRNTGYYSVSGNRISVDFGNDGEFFEMEYVLDGDNLMLTNGTVTLHLQKYKLD
ncbi:MAG: hypothetical protein IKL24_03790 [Clostridia bacterium]|nr:hypothetical protein [Clostridia bacterium]